MTNQFRNASVQNTRDILTRLGLSNAQADRAVTQLLSQPVSDVRRLDQNVKYFPVRQSSINLMKRSSELEASDWLKFNVTVTANTVTGPFRQFSGDRCEATTVSPAIRQDAAWDARDGLGMACTCWMKAGSGPTEINRMAVLRNGTTVISEIALNFETGAVVEAIGSHEVVVSDDDGDWYRVTILVQNGFTEGDTLNFFPVYQNGNAGIGQFGYRYGCQVAPYAHVPTFRQTFGEAEISERYDVPLPDLIAGVNIVGIRLAGPHDVYLPLRAVESQIIAVSDERGTADTDNIVVRVG